MAVIVPAFNYRCSQRFGKPREFNGEAARRKLLVADSFGIFLSYVHMRRLHFLQLSAWVNSGSMLPM
jgi:predicted AAA+ superfamily ATPase